MKAQTVVAVALLAANAVYAAEYADPERFRGAIDAFQAAEAESVPARGAVVATGSSSMRGWHGRIADDLAPLTIIPRGFGGSNMHDVRHFLNELVLRHEPRAVLLYEGDNDVAAGLAPEQILAEFDAIDAAIAERLPETRIYILAVKPSIARWGALAHHGRHERPVQGRADNDPRLTYIDIATPMLGEDGKPLAEIFIADMLHMNGLGYDIWRDAVRGVLVEAERAYE